MHPDKVWSGQQTRRVPARVWFEPEPESVVLTEMTKVVGCHDQIWTLLWMLNIERVRGDPRHDDEGRWEPGRRKGPPPVRNLDRPR